MSSNSKLFGGSMGASEFHKDNETGNGSHLPEVAAFGKKICGNGLYN